MSNLLWKTKIKAQVLDTPENLKLAFPNMKRLAISGIAIDDTVNANEWALSKDEMPNVAEQLKGKQLTINHDTNVESVVGKITDAKANDKSVEFTAEIISENGNVLIPIISSLVDSVSIEADAESACSVCGKIYISGLKPCKCSEDHQVIKNVKVERLSIVANPAYEKTKFIPVSFAAAIDEKLKEVKVMDENKTKVNEMAEIKTEDKKAEEREGIPAEILKELQERLKKAEEAIAEIRKKAEEEEEEEEEDKCKSEEEEPKEEEDEEEEEKKEAKKKKVAKIDKTKSVGRVDTSQDLIPPEESQKETPKGGFQEFFADMKKKFNVTG